MFLLPYHTICAFGQGKNRTGGPAARTGAEIFIQGKENFFKKIDQKHLKVKKGQSIIKVKVKDSQSQ
jgi:hypothetical protein